MLKVLLSCSLWSLAAADGGHPAVFVAGLEGTGHHFWGKVFGECAAQGSCQKPPRRIEDSLFKVRRPFAVAASWSEEGLARAESLTVLNTLESRGELSYPYGPEGLDNPMLDLYTAAAHENGDDLKVILTLRDADDIMKSVQGRWNHSEETMVTSANILLDHLRTVPEGSLFCVDHSSLPESGDRVRAFLESGHEESALPFDYAAAFRAQWDQTLNHKCSNEVCKAPKLADALKQFRVICSPPAPTSFLAEHPHRYGRKQMHSPDLHSVHAPLHGYGRV